MKHRLVLILLSSLFIISGCITKDGILTPENGVFAIIEDGKSVEANNYSVMIPHEGGTIQLAFVFGGEESASAKLVYGNPDQTVDGLHIRWLDDAQRITDPNRWGIASIRQTLEINASPNNSKLKKKNAVYLATNDGIAKLIVIQQ